MSDLELHIDRSFLELDPLVLRGVAPAALPGMAIVELEEPTFDYRKTYAPPSRYVAGQLLLAAVLEQGSIPATILLEATSAAGLTALRTELSAALAQWYYPVTLVVGADSADLRGEISTPRFGIYRPGWNKTHRAVAGINIPVNPT